MNKVVIAVVPGCSSGSHSLHVVCDMTIALRSTPFLSKPMRCCKFLTVVWLAYLAKQVRKERGNLLPGAEYSAQKPTMGGKQSSAA